MNISNVANKGHAWLVSGKVALDPVRDGGSSLLIRIGGDAEGSWSTSDHSVVWHNFAHQFWTSMGALSNQISVNPSITVGLIRDIKGICDSISKHVARSLIVGVTASAKTQTLRRRRTRRTYSQSTNTGYRHQCRNQ